MAAKDNRADNRGSARERDLPRFGVFRKGAQVINTQGMPAGYEPPSASISPPASSPPAPQEPSISNDRHAGKRRSSWLSRMMT